MTRHFFKRRHSNQELVSQDAQRPQVDMVGMRLALYHFRREVIERAAQGRPAIRRGMDGPSKVANLQIAIQAEQDVLGLDIPVDDVFRVKVFERVCHLSNVLLTTRQREATREERAYAGRTLF
jgi:hypothetical protein